MELGKCAVDWQVSKKTVLERNSHMFNNSIMSDISFTCEGSSNEIPAHKYVLATSSPVFYAMFYADLAEKGSAVHLRGINEEILLEFLRFLYTDQCVLNADNVLSVMYLSKKYIVPSLSEKCQGFIMENVNYENVLNVLEQAIRFEEEEILAKCWMIIEVETVDIVSSEEFKNISQTTMTEILKRDYLNISELELFKAVLGWCDVHILKESREVTGENRRSVLGEAIYEMCFLSMMEQDFARNVPSSGLLTAEEIVPIYGMMNKIDSPSVKWKRIRKRRKEYRRVTRFSKDKVKNPGSWWSYESSSPDKLSFSANKQVLFQGVRLFGDRNQGQYDVTLEVHDVKISGKYTSEVDEDDIPGFDVLLLLPIVVKKDEKLTMTAKITGPCSCYGDNDRSSVTTDQVTTVNFYDAPKPNNGTTRLKGQFYQVLIS